MGFIDVNFNEGDAETATSLSKILNWAIPFILGLLSAFLIDWIKQKFKHFKLRKFTINHLKNNILPQIKKLQDEFLRLKIHLQNIDTHRMSLEVFDNLNTNSLEAAELTDYYSIFGDSFEEFNEIKHAIKYHSTNLPMSFITHYFDIVNDHLKEKNALGDFNHIKNCPFCIDCRDVSRKNIELRLGELSELEKKINYFVEKFKTR